jgi:hypothetical protein
MSASPPSIAVAKPAKHSELGPFLLLCVCYIIVGIKFFRFISRYAVNLFITDQWDFHRATLFEDHSLWEIFRWQHGPHRQGLGGVISKLVDSYFQWSSRAQSFEAGAIILLAAIFALCLKRRLFGRIDYFDSAIPLLFLTRNQFEPLIAATNISHGPVPLMLVILYCLAWTLQSAPARYVCILPLNFLLIYTGFGVFAGLLTPVLLLLEYLHLRRSIGGANFCIAAVALSALSLFSFFIGYRFDPAADCFANRTSNPVEYIWFVALMFANFVGAKSTKILPTIIGGLILAALAVVLTRGAQQLFRLSAPQTKICLVVTSLSAYVLLFCANAAIGRICFGVDAAQQSRYMTYLIPGFLALYFSATALRTAPQHYLLRLVVLLIIGWSSLHLHNWDWLTARNHSRDRTGWRECYLKLESVDQCTAMTGFEVHPSPEGTHLKEKLDFLKQRHLNLYADER